MTHEEQRIALAEWAGWKRPDHPDVMKVKEGWTMPEEWWMCPQGVLRFKYDIPDYPKDLNAVHELLRPERFIPPGNPSKTGYWLELVCVCGSTENTAFATAAQRCEALLKTLNLWKGGNP